MAWPVQPLPNQLAGNYLGARKIVHAAYRSPGANWTPGLYYFLYEMEGYPLEVYVVDQDGDFRGYARKADMEFSTSPVGIDPFINRPWHKNNRQAPWEEKKEAIVSYTALALRVPEKHRAAVGGEAMFIGDAEVLEDTPSGVDRLKKYDLIPVWRSSPGYIRTFLLSESGYYWEEWLLMDKNVSFLRAGAEGAPKSKVPELPPECWRDAYGLTRQGIDFSAVTRSIVETKGGK